MDEKQRAFVYFCRKIYDWYSEHKEPEKNDLSVLKVLKLLFFVSAFKRFDSGDLLDVFNNYHAMPYGPVELDIYTNLSLINNQSRLKVGRNSMLDCGTMSVTDTSPTCLIMLDLSIDEFKKKHPKMVTFDAFKLVEISHRWDSWNKSRNFAALKGLNTWPIDRGMIRKDKQYFG